MAKADPRQVRLLGNAACLAVHASNTCHMLLTLRGDVLRDRRLYNIHIQQFVFFTIWNVIFQISYLVANILCLTQEIYKINDRGLLKPVKAFKQLFFEGVAFPYALVVAVVFWAFFIYDRELLYPAYIDEAIGALPNYIMHGFIIPVVLWELRYMPRKGNSEGACLALLTIVNLCYVIALFGNYYMTGLWPYPVLHTLDGTVYLYALLTGAILTSYLCYYLQSPLRALISIKYEGTTRRKLNKGL